MKVGQVISVPNPFSRFGRVQDGSGVGYTVAEADLPEGVSEGDEVSYKVELWGNDSGLAHSLKIE